MVTIFLAQGFEEMEALAPLDLLRRAGIPVQTAAVTDSPLSADEKAADRLVVTGSHGVRFVCDLAAEQVTEEQMQMLVLPGGMPGTKHLGSSPLVDRWLRYAQQEGVFVGAICAAPSVLGERGCCKIAVPLPFRALSRREQSAPVRAWCATGSTSPQRERESALNLVLSWSAAWQEKRPLDR